MDQRQMTVEYCIDGCAVGDYNYAGLEYGSECWCSSTPPNYDPVDPSECDMGCTGDAAAVCGGVSRILVYSKSE
ncbi:concanavalin A-like lectin/glucanase domain-containing protein [Apiospora rasikravindrae]|uniref:Concanavalin A-like lectin/glucanase domain-containing protein n=1 Tax=Apiospora rasikravindrae TaxID=990691 RepID=A0ABR1SWP4_9PEZI